MLGAEEALPRAERRLKVGFPAIAIALQVREAPRGRRVPVRVCLRLAVQAAARGLVLVARQLIVAAVLGRKPPQTEVIRRWYR